MRSLSVLSLALTMVASLAGQTQKKSLTQTDWDRWQSISGSTISADGRWVAYTISPQVGDAEFVVRATTGTTEYRVPIGWTARPNNNPGGLSRANLTPPPAAQPAGTNRPNGTGGPFTADGRFAFVGTQAPRADVERAQAATRAAAAARGRGGAAAPAGGNAGAAAGTGGRGAAAAPAIDTALTNAANRTALVIIDLTTGERTEMPKVTNYRLPRFNSTWMTYTGGVAQADSAAGDSAAAGGGRGGPGGRGGAGAGAGGGAGGAAAGARRTLGSAVTLRNLTTGDEERLTDLSFYAWDDSAKVMVYVIGSRSDSTKDGLYIRNMTTGTVQTVMAGAGNYRGFTFDRTQQRFVFYSDRDQWGKTDEPKATLYLGSLRTPGTVTPLLHPDSLPTDFTLGNTASFNRAATALTVTLQGPPADSVLRDSLVGKANFDLWHWKDVQLQPAQKLNPGSRIKSYQAIYFLDTKKLVKLATDSVTSIQLSDDGKVGVAQSSMAYDQEKLWGGDGNDVFVIDPRTGASKQIATKITGSVSLSVGGKYAMYFDNTHWYSYDVASGKTINLTSNVPGGPFHQETWSTPNPAPAWGIAGWTPGDRSVLIYDRFDLWEFDPTGARAPIVVTDSLGRRESLVFRLTDLEQDRVEERTIDPAKPLYFRVFSEETKGSGFYSDRLGARQAPTKILWDDLNFGTPTRATNAQVYMMTRSTFVDPPNLWVGPSLTEMTRISDINPFQREYNWGTAELVTWTSDDGMPLQGILFKPENFDSTKKYPLISYFYEDLSDGLHSYVPPTGRNVINATHYVSNGYLIFMPDIYYLQGHPGPSALKSIVPGVQMLLRRGYVDPKGLGLQGQSWGGYQIAYMITQTRMFSAAMAGAPVANMTSAYGGIRWGSGLARTFQYENTQSRIGKTLWEAPQLYIENSPLFWLDRVETPLFIMHNDQDDAVPWYQGIELFVGLKRLGKEVYMINYNNDVHNPSSRANQKDMAMRMEQFFDAKLKGAPEPDWMRYGIHQRDKGRDLYTTPPKEPVGGGNR